VRGFYAQSCWEEEAMKIGFIGLGTMGQHMAMNLLRGGHA
jgi:6-phosphogluconate dehydrogenase